MDLVFGGCFGLIRWVGSVGAGGSDLIDPIDLIEFSVFMWKKICECG